MRNANYTGLLRGNSLPRHSEICAAIIDISDSFAGQSGCDDNVIIVILSALVRAAVGAVPSCSQAYLFLYSLLCIVSLNEINGDGDEQCQLERQLVQTTRYLYRR